MGHICRGRSSSVAGQLLFTAAHDLARSERVRQRRGPDWTCGSRCRRFMQSQYLLLRWTRRNGTVSSQLGTSGMGCSAVSGHAILSRFLTSILHGMFGVLRGCAWAVQQSSCLVTAVSFSCAGCIGKKGGSSPLTTCRAMSVIFGRFASNCWRLVLNGRLHVHFRVFVLSLPESVTFPTHFPRLWSSRRIVVEISMCPGWGSRSLDKHGPQRMRYKQMCNCSASSS